MLYMNETPDEIGVGIHGDYPDLANLKDSLERVTGTWREYMTMVAESAVHDGILNRDEGKTLKLMYESVPSFVNPLLEDIDSALHCNEALEFIDATPEPICPENAETPEGREMLEEVAERAASGNMYLYFVEHWPYLLYCLFTLEAMFDIAGTDCWIDPKEVKQYFVFRSDIDTVKGFMHLLWQAFADCVGYENVVEIYDDMQNEDGLEIPNYMYMMAIEQFFFHNEEKRNAKEAMLILYAALMAFTDDYTSNTDMNLSKWNDIVIEETGKGFPTLTDFFDNIDEYESAEKSVIEDGITEFLEEYYGEVNWDRIGRTVRIMPLSANRGNGMLS